MMVCHAFMWEDQSPRHACAGAHRAVPLADAVLAHDVEDAVPDGVAVAAAARQPRQRHAREPPRLRACVQHVPVRASTWNPGKP